MNRIPMETRVKVKPTTHPDAPTGTVVGISSLTLAWFYVVLLDTPLTVEGEKWRAINVLASELEVLEGKPQRPTEQSQKDAHTIDVLVSELERLKIESDRLIQNGAAAVLKSAKLIRFLRHKLEETLDCLRQNEVDPDNVAIGIVNSALKEIQKGPAPAGRWQKETPKAGGKYWVATRDGLVTGPETVAYDPDGNLIYAAFPIRSEDLDKRGWLGWWWSEPIEKPEAPTEPYDR